MGFSCCLERFEGAVPELIEPRADRIDPGGIDAVQSPGAVGAIRHQACRLEDCEVLGHRRA